MTFKIYTGESLAECLSALGLPCTFLQEKIAPQNVRYYFTLANLRDDTKLKNAIRRLSMYAGKTFLQVDSRLAGSHFCLEMARENEQREYPTFFQTHSALDGKKDGSFLIGIDENNETITKNIEDCPHLLVAGQTNSGKSVFLNTVICSISCYSAHTGLVLIDPKQVEFAQFENCNRLMCPIITSVDEAIARLNQLCDIMDERYTRLREMGLQDNKTGVFDKIVCIVDELADLMLTSGKAVETPLVRLAQKGRASGMHLVLATQRPTVNVVTGLLKANIPTRIGFSMASNRDSVVLLDKGGAEKLLGNGDALVKFADKSELVRVQAPYTTSKEIQHIFANSQPRNWNTPTTAKTPPTARKRSWLDKLLRLTRKGREKGQDDSIDKLNYADCIDEEN